MNKQEVISKLKSAIPKNNVDDYQKGETAGLNFALLLLAELDESEKPVVPQFVAEWIEDHKEDYSKWNEEARADFVFRGINDLFRFGEGLSPWDFAIDEKISDWTTKNAYEFITAILFDYTVKKEKLYTVEIPNPNGSGYSKIYLAKNKDGKVELFIWSGYTSIEFADNWEQEENAQLTEAEIKQDFAWAWQFAEEVEE